MAVILGVAAIGAWLIGTDQVSYVITHGVSMNPVYYQGDLVLVVKSRTYKVGQIAAYHGAGEEVLHRIIGGDAATGYVLKGDNNQSIDITTPTADEVIGHAVLHVPKGGIWLKPVLSPTGLGMIGFLVIGGGAATPRNRRELPRGRRKKKVKAMARQGGSWATAMALAKTVSRLPPILMTLAGAAAFTTLVAIALGVLGWMKPVVEQRLGSDSPQTMTFSYSATVPRSPAYDSTTATSPDPIFRKLANRVDLRMRYVGKPGTFDASTILSDDSGWKANLALVAARKTSGNSLDTTVRLDLNALEARQRAAATAIGVQPGALTITINTRVINAAGTFAAPLALRVTPVLMALPNGASDLTVTDKTAEPATFVARTIGTTEHPIMTAARARGLAVLLLLGAAAAVAAIFLVVRRSVPLRTRAEIERRHPNLLVHVEPMTLTPGQAVVNVDTFPALVKLAERYGQMILTWRQPEADDFVVRDDGITYRFRIPLDEPALHNVERVVSSTAGSHRRKAPTPYS
jgi:signal peptidase I